jgi:hypothetical protein
MNATAKRTIDLEFNTEGYDICTLYADGVKVSRCNGGGYDMQGTCLGDYIARAYADRLLALTADDMPQQSHWEPNRHPVRDRTCCDCKNEWTSAVVMSATTQNLSGEKSEQCPDCHSTEIMSGPIYQGTLGWNDGQRVDDGRYFYGLTYHDPNYDPGKAIVGQECTDRTIGSKAGGKTVEQAEADGESLGLERYQAAYKASSKHPTATHTVPLIDGACGFDSVAKIAEAIGVTLQYVPSRSKKLTLYTLHDAR